MDSKKTKKQGDLFVLSPDLQQKRNKMFGIKPGETPMYDLTEMSGKIVTFDKYDSMHNEWACRISGQRALHTHIFEFLIPESALIPVEDKLKELIKKTDIKGVYKHIKKDPKVDVFLFAFEVAQQANTNEGSKKGIENCVGTEITEFCVQLYPNIRLGDPYTLDTVFGIWKDRNIYLDSLRDKNWNRKS